MLDQTSFRRPKRRWARIARFLDKYGIALLRYVLMIVGIFMAAGPYIYMILQSLAPWREVNRK